MLAYHIDPYRQQQEAAGCTPSSTPAAAGPSRDSEPQQAHVKTAGVVSSSKKRTSVTIEQFVATIKLKTEQFEKRRAARAARQDAEAKKLQELADLLDAEERADFYGETLKDLIILLHQKVWWQIDRLAPELATEPKEFFELEWCCFPTHIKAVRDAVDCVGMSMTDYGDLVQAYDNRGSMYMYDSDLSKDPVKLLQYIQDKATPDEDGWVRVCDIVLRNEKCFLGDPRDTTTTLL